MRSRGFTLVEVIIAITILMFVFIAIGGATGAFIRLTAQAETQAVATQLVQERLEQVLMDPNYGGLDSTYATVEASLAGMPGYERETTITRVGGGTQSTDHKVITVTVSAPGLAGPITRTTTVAAP